MQMLDILDAWIDEIPPFPTPQRFGNLAFRTWGQRLEDVRPLSFACPSTSLTRSPFASAHLQNIPSLLSSLLPPSLHPSVPHLSPYLLTSFGSFKRMDYGTGHELSFALFLCCLSLLRFFAFPADRNSASTSDSTSDSRSPSTGASPDLTDPTPASPSTHAHASTPQSDVTEDLTVALARALALKLYPRYLRLTWRLQDTYNLEPAGSHGVWGLDDSNFLGYIWGSGQLRGEFEFILFIHYILHYRSWAILCVMPFRPQFCLPFIFDILNSSFSHLKDNSLTSAPNVDRLAPPPNINSRPTAFTPYKSLQPPHHANPPSQTRSIP